MTAEKLGFDRPMANSLDGVSDRDFALETLAAATIAAIHFSRLAEEIVIWMTPQFGFITLSDKFTTGSSIMPQKRNPDAAELSRAKVGRIAGSFQSLAMVMKGLPLAYSKDMQEDKEVTFDALESLKLVIAAMAGMIADLQPVPEVMRTAAGRGYSTATDLADWLSRRPRRSASTLSICLWPICRKSSRASQRRCFQCSALKTRSKAGSAMGEPRHRTC